MARPREEWPADKVKLARGLIDAGVAAASVCIILEDEFGGTCSEGTLRRRADECGIRWPGRETANRRNGAALPWSDEKNKRLAELLAADTPKSQVARILRDEFGASHSKNTLYRKAREMGFSVPCQPQPVDVVACEAPTQISDFSDLKMPAASCPTLKYLHTECQYPIEQTGRRGYRFCGERISPGKTYCETHHNICYESIR